MSVMPICTDESNRFGVCASSSATLARALPLLTQSCSRDLRAVITAISDIANTPFARINTEIVNISPPISAIAFTPPPNHSRKSANSQQRRSCEPTHRIAPPSSRKKRN